MPLGAPGDVGYYYTTSPQGANAAFDALFSSPNAYANWLNEQQGNHYMPLGAGVPGAAGSFYYPSTAPSGFTYRSFAETGIFWTPAMGDNRAPDTAVTVNEPWSMVTNPFGYAPPGGSAPVDTQPVQSEPAYVPPAPVFNTPPPPPPAPVPYTNPIPEQVVVQAPVYVPPPAPIYSPALDLSVAAPLPNNTGGTIAIDTPPPPPPATTSLTALALAAMPDGTTFIAPNGHSITKYIFKNIGIVGAGEPEVGWSDNTTGEWVFDPAQFGVLGYTVQWQSVPEQVVVQAPIYVPVATSSPALDLSVAAPVPDFTGGSPDTQPVPYTDNTVEQVVITANKLPPAPVANTSPALDLSVAAPVPDFTGGAADNTPYTDNTPEQVTVTAQRPEPPQVLPVAVAPPPVVDIAATQTLDSFPSDFTPGEGSPKVKWPKEPGKPRPFNSGSTPQTPRTRAPRPAEDLHPWQALHDFWNTAPNRTAKNKTVVTPRTTTARPQADLHPWQALRDFWKQAGATNAHGSGIDLTTHGAVVQSNAQPAQSMNWLLILLAAVGVFIAERD